jgi:imidazolonepropionase-like amidohydrolase
MSVPAYHLNATILPDGDRPVDLWIVDGRISFQPRDNAEELAPAGAYAVPGLVDAHTHLTMDFGRTGLPEGSRELVDANRRAYLAAGTLLLRDVGALSDSTLGLSADDGLPRVLPAGRFLAPAGGYCGYEQPTPAEALSETALQQLTAGARWIKIIVDWPGGDFRQEMLEFGCDRLNYSLEALAAAAESVHEAGGRVAAHTFSKEGARLSVAAGIDSIEHGWGLDDDLLVEMAAKGIGWTPTLSLGPLMIGDAEARGKPHVAGWVAERLKQLERLVPRARRLGVPILAGTDVLPAGCIAHEVAALHQAGLEPKDALAAASTAARRFLREPVLDEGKTGNLVLYSHDPREASELLSHPTLIMLNGKLVPVS